MNNTEKNEIRSFIDYAIEKAIKEFKKKGILKDASEVAYAEVSKELTAYYLEDLGEFNSEIRQALDDLRLDPYIDIIPLYYSENRTIEDIAEVLGVDVSTVVRNKKRLCLDIYFKVF